MSEEHLYTVDGANAVAARRVTLTEAGLTERAHLQEWVIAHPEILGEDVLVVTFEFDRWMTAGGHSTLERLDVLAVDTMGRLVVAELKRDRAPDSVVVQALNYAAMVSRFTLDLLAEAYAARRGGEIDAEAAAAELREWAPTISDETLGPPRIVLVAEDFGPVVTNTTMFLIEQDLDMRLVRLQLYRIPPDVLVLTTSQLLPVPEAEAFMVRPRSTATTQRASREAQGRRAAITQRLIEHQALPDGQELRIIVPANVRQERDQIATWLAEDDERSRVRWHNDASLPIEWLEDGTRWTMKSLMTEIVARSTGAAPLADVWGPNWLLDPEGRPLHRLADIVDPPATSFDWSQLHEILHRIPPGRWTTYGDLAQVVGTAAQPLGGHIASCSECPSAWRVLGADRRPRPQFAWTDPSEVRSQQDALEGEGVTFTNGTADVSQRMGPAELASLT